MKSVAYYGGVFGSVCAVFEQGTEKNSEKCLQGKSD